MSMIRFVTPDGLPAFLAYLSQNGRRVLVPVEKPANKRSVVFEPWQEGKPFTLEKATVPAKEAVLPQCETLVRYKKTKDPENPGHGKQGCQAHGLRAKFRVRVIMGA